MKRFNCITTSISRKLMGRASKMLLLVGGIIGLHTTEIFAESEVSVGIGPAASVYIIKENVTPDKQGANFINDEQAEVIIEKPRIKNGDNCEYSYELKSVKESGAGGKDIAFQAFGDVYRLVVGKKEVIYTWEVTTPKPGPEKKQKLTYTVSYSRYIVEGSAGTDFYCDAFDRNFCFGNNTSVDLITKIPSTSATGKKIDFVSAVGQDGNTLMAMRTEVNGVGNTHYKVVVPKGTTKITFKWSVSTTGWGMTGLPEDLEYSVNITDFTPKFSVGNVEDVVCEGKDKITFETPNVTNPVDHFIYTYELEGKQNGQNVQISENGGVYEADLKGGNVAFTWTVKAKCLLDNCEAKVGFSGNFTKLNPTFGVQNVKKSFCDEAKSMTIKQPTVSNAIAGYTYSYDLNAVQGGNPVNVTKNGEEYVSNVVDGIVDYTWTVTASNGTKECASNGTFMGTYKDLTVDFTMGDVSGDLCMKNGVGRVSINVPSGVGFGKSDRNYTYSLVGTDGVGNVYNGTSTTSVVDIDVPKGRVDFVMTVKVSDGAKECENTANFVGNYTQKPGPRFKDPYPQGGQTLWTCSNGNEYAPYKTVPTQWLEMENPGNYAYTVKAYTPEGRDTTITSVTVSGNQISGLRGRDAHKTNSETRLNKVKGINDIIYKICAYDLSAVEQCEGEPLTITVTDYPRPYGGSLGVTMDFGGGREVELKDATYCAGDEAKAPHFRFLANNQNNPYVFWNSEVQSSSVFDWYLIKETDYERSKMYFDVNSTTNRYTFKIDINALGGDANDLPNSMVINHHNGARGGYDEYGNTGYFVSDINDPDPYTKVFGGYYFIAATIPDNCKRRDTAMVHVYFTNGSEPTVQINRCNTDQVEIHTEAANNAQEYIWKNKEGDIIGTSKNYPVTQAGEYEVTAIITKHNDGTANCQLTQKFVVEMPSETVEADKHIVSNPSNVSSNDGVAKLMAISGFKNDITGGGVYGYKYEDITDGHESTFESATLMTVNNGGEAVVSGLMATLDIEGNRLSGRDPYKYAVYDCKGCRTDITIDIPVGCVPELTVNQNYRPIKKYFSEDKDPCSVTYIETKENIINNVLNIQTCNNDDYQVWFQVKDPQGNVIVPHRALEEIEITCYEGKYIIEYVMVDTKNGNQPVTDKVEEEVLAIDDIAPEAMCIDTWTTALDDYSECKVNAVITYQDYAYNYLIKYGVLNADSTVNAEYASAYGGKMDTVRYEPWDNPKSGITMFTDNCGKEVMVRYETNTGARGVLSVNPATVTVYGDTRSASVKWKVYDQAKIEGPNVSDVCVTSVVAIDKNPPIIETPEEIVLDANAQCLGDTVITEEDIRTVLDPRDCSMPVTIAYIDTTEENGVVKLDTLEAVDGKFDIRGIKDGDVIKWVAIDAVGNSTSVDQKVKVVDRTGPDVDCDAIFQEKNIVIDDEFYNAGKCANGADLVSAGVVTSIPLDTLKKYVHDNCTDQIENIAVDTIRIFYGVGEPDTFRGKDVFDTLFAVGRHEIVWSFTDLDTNSTTCSQIVTIENNAPDLDCPEKPINLGADSEACKFLLGNLDIDSMFVALAKNILIKNGILNEDGTIKDTDKYKTWADVVNAEMKTECGAAMEFKAVMTIKKWEGVDGLDVEVKLPTTDTYKFKIGDEFEITYSVKDELGNYGECAVKYEVTDEEGPRFTKGDNQITLLEREENYPHSNSSCKAEDGMTRDDALALFGVVDCSEEDIKVYYCFRDSVKGDLSDKDFALSEENKVYILRDGRTWRRSFEVLGKHYVNWVFVDGKKNRSVGTEVVTVIDNTAPIINCDGGKVTVPVYADANCEVSFELTPLRLMADLRADIVLDPLAEGKKYFGSDVSVYSKSDSAKIMNQCDLQSVNYVETSGDTVVYNGEGATVNFSKGTGFIKIAHEYVIKDPTGNKSVCEVTYALTDSSQVEIDKDAFKDTIRVYYPVDKCYADYKAAFDEVKTWFKDNCTDPDDFKIWYSIVAFKDAEGNSVPKHEEVLPDGNTIPSAEIALTKTADFNMKHLWATDTIDVRWTVIDDSDKPLVVPQVFVVIDSVAPQVDCSRFPTLTVNLTSKEQLDAFNVNPWSVLLPGGKTYKEYFSFVGDCDVDSIVPIMIREKNGKKDTLTGTSLDSFEIGTTVIKMEFWDLHGNKKECEQIVEVNDNMKPELVCPPTNTEPKVCGKSAEDLGLIDAKEISLKQFVEQGGVILGGQHIAEDAKIQIADSLFDKNNKQISEPTCDYYYRRTYKVTTKTETASGVKLATCSQDVWVKDTVPPVWAVDKSKLKLETTVSCNDVDGAVLDLKAKDYCSDVANVKYDVVSEQGADPTKCSHYQYDLLKKYYAVDGCNNVLKDTITYTVHVADTTKPYMEINPELADESKELGIYPQKPCIFLMPDLTDFVDSVYKECFGKKGLTISQVPAAYEELTPGEVLTAKIIVSDLCGAENVFEKTLKVPTRKSVVTASARDTFVCENAEDVLVLRTMFDATGTISYIYHNKLRTITPVFGTDYYKNAPDRNHLNYDNWVFTTNETTKNLAIKDGVSQEKLNQVKNTDTYKMNSFTKGGKYYYVAMDSVVGCRDTAEAIITVGAPPRIAMDSGFVEACEYQSLPVTGGDVDFADKYNVCVEPMASDIVEDGWMLDGKVYKGEPITYEHDQSKLVYYAKNACGTTTSDKSLVWNCDWTYDSTTGKFTSDNKKNPVPSMSDMLTEESSASLGLHIHEHISSDGILLRPLIEENKHIWQGTPVELEMFTKYTDGIELHWHRVVGAYDATSQKYDAFGNILEEDMYIGDDPDVLLGKTDPSSEGGKRFMIDNPTDTSFFYVVVTDNLCSSAASNVVQVSTFNKIPTAFTPYNSLGFNDIFMEGFKVQIFNRYGGLVFEGDNGWDGTIRGYAADPATYFYVINIGQDTYRGTIEIVYFK